jgi:hypothetical protein
MHNGSVAVGATGNDVAANGNEGAVYVFTGAGATWSLQQKLTRADATPGEALGSAVAIRGDTIVCGVPNFDGIVGTNQGMGASFTRSGNAWAASEVFMPNETQAQSGFGSAAAMSDEFVAMGATNWSKSGANFSGAAYAFRRADGTPARTLTLAAPTPQTDANFGNRLAGDSTRLIVGAYNEDGGAGANQGAVYVYKFQNESFVLEQKLLPSVQQAGAAFGRAIALDGTTLLVGAPNEDDAVADAGAAYVFFFNGSTWSQQARLASQEPAAANLFGWAVAVSGNRAVIGSPNDDVVLSAVNRVDLGSADSFLRTGSTWALEREFVESTGIGAESAGRSVAVSGDFVAVGIPGNDAGASPIDRGGVRFYRWNGASWVTYTMLEGSAAGQNVGWSMSMSDGLFGVGTRSEQIRFYLISGTNIVAPGILSNTSVPGFGEVFALTPTRLVVGIPSWLGAGTTIAYARSGTTFSSLGYHHPGTIAASDNLGEAVAAVGSEIFAGAGGGSVPGGSNQGVVRRLRHGGTLDPFPRNVSTNTPSLSISALFGGAANGQSLQSEFGPLARDGSVSFSGK